METPTPDQRNAQAVQPYDPESLLTGAEIARGMSYRNPRRYPSEEVRKAAYAGCYTPEQLAEIAPRS